MKKICYVTTIGGTLESFVLPFAEYLHDAGNYEITFICDKDERFAASLPGYIRYIPVPMKRGISLGGIKAMLQLRNIFKREKFDLIEYSTPNASFYASLAAKSINVPVRVYCQRGLIYLSFSGLKRKIFKLIEKTVCRLSTNVESVSFGNLELSRQENILPPDGGTVIGSGSACGVDLKKFNLENKRLWRETIRNKYHIKDKTTVCGFVGRITKDKGINELLAATKRILSDDVNMCLLLVGAIELQERLDAELLKFAENEPRIIFCGTTNAVEQYYSAMDFLVLPSYREGFGMVTVEAEAMGVPVIVSDIPGPAETILPNQTGLLIKKADVNSLESAMRMLINDPQLRKRFGHRAHEFVAEKYEQQTVFRDILEERNRLLGVEK